MHLFQKNLSQYHTSFSFKSTTLLYARCWLGPHLDQTSYPANKTINHSWCTSTPTQSSSLLIHRDPILSSSHQSMHLFQYLNKGKHLKHCDNTVNFLSWCIPELQRHMWQILCNYNASSKVHIQSWWCFIMEVLSGKPQKHTCLTRIGISQVNNSELSWFLIYLGCWLWGLL